MIELFIHRGSAALLRVRDIALAHASTPAGALEVEDLAERMAVALDEGLQLVVADLAPDAAGVAAVDRLLDPTSSLPLLDAQEDAGMCLDAMA